MNILLHLGPASKQQENTEPEKAKKRRNKARPNERKIGFFLFFNLSRNANHSKKVAYQIAPCINQ